MTNTVKTFLISTLLLLSVSISAQIKVEILSDPLPPSLEDDTINVCRLQEIILEAQVFDNNDQELNNDDYEFAWNFGDNSIVDYGDSLSYYFIQGGGYFIHLTATHTITSLGLKAEDILPVRVATKPTYNEITSNVDETTVCKGDSVELTGAVEPVSWTYEPVLTRTETFPWFVGQNLKYEKSIRVESFAVGETLGDIDSLDAICVEMEHSNIATLQIAISCPDGTNVILKDYGGTDAFMGQPVDEDRVSDVSPGTGFIYCWTPEASDIFAETSAYYTYADSEDSTYTDRLYIPAGNYASENPMEVLAGCPLNGEWTLQIYDNSENDNGYVFNWELDLADTLYYPAWTFENSYDLSFSYWSGDSIRYTEGIIGYADTKEYDANTYFFHVLDDFGCWDSAAHDVMVSLPSFSYADSEEENKEFTKTFTDETDWGASYYWEFGDGNDEEELEGTITHKYNKDGTYIAFLTVTSEQGCVDIADSVEVMVKAKDPEIKADYNVITPNGDGVNDIFKVEVTGTYKDFTGTVFNRWGRRLYKWTDPQDGWDGKETGQILGTGAYFYYIEVKTLEGKTKKEKGTVYIVREK